MSPGRPSVDAHAHINVDADPSNLAKLNAAVFAVTRSIIEWEAASRRRDQLVAWGIGCHPADERAVEDFSPEHFIDRLADASFVGEVGLDARSHVHLRDQQRVLEAILSALQRFPRPVSIHSVGRMAEVVRAVTVRPIKGAILHWWRGDRDLTQKAVDLGCYFSLNAAEVAEPRVAPIVPRERILTETDYPFTRRQDPDCRQPGATEAVERYLAICWQTDQTAVRNQVWRNLRTLLRSTDSGSRLPAGFQAQLLRSR